MCSFVFLVFGVSSYGSQLYAEHFFNSAAYTTVLEMMRNSTDLEALRQAALSCVAEAPERTGWRRWVPNESTVYILAAGFCFLISAVSLRQIPNDSP